MGALEEWDGTINNFSIIHTTVEDVTSVTDNNILSPGRYCYVVVAFNQGGNSIPSAYKIIECSTSATPITIALNNDISNQVRNYSASYMINVGNSNPVTISNSSDVVFCSGNEIIFDPGTSILSGTNVIAKISSCPGCSYLPSGMLYKHNAINNQNAFISNEYFIATDMLSIQPNPFNNETNISISLSDESSSSLAIYDMLGNKIASLADNVSLGKGSHSFTFSSAGLSSGTFYVVLTTPQERISKTIVLMK